MHVALRAGSAAVLLVGALAPKAGADMSVYYHAGGWDAFSGPGDNSQPVCGVGNTNPVDGRSFSIRFRIGTDAVMFEARKPNWNIPSGTDVPVVIQVGLDTPWSMHGNGDGQKVQWALDRTAMRAFDAQFRTANSMTVTFPTGSEPPWTIGLNGSTAISNAFGRCVSEVQRRAAAQALAAQPPAGQAPATTTQPFGAGSAPPPAAPPAAPPVVAPGQPSGTPKP